MRVFLSQMGGHIELAEVAANLGVATRAMRVPCGDARATSQKRSDERLDILGDGRNDTYAGDRHGPGVDPSI
jgi:hypothetical protein